MGVPQLEDSVLLVQQPSSYFRDDKRRQQQHGIESSKSLLEVNTSNTSAVDVANDDISQRSPRRQPPRGTALLINAIDDEDESLGQFLDLDGCNFNPFLCGCAGCNFFFDGEDDEENEAPLYLAMCAHAERMIEVLFSSRSSISTPTASPNASSS
jgi:hypothetical protein